MVHRNGESPLSASVEPGPANDNMKEPVRHGLATHDLSDTLRNMIFDPRVKADDLDTPKARKFIEEVFFGSKEYSDERVRAIVEERGLHELRALVSLSTENIKTEAEGRVESICENFSRLRSTLDRHEAKIQKRWLKKTTSQHLRILLEAWGSKMSLYHRPDYERMSRKGFVPGHHPTAEIREAFIWPYINQDDLCKPRNMLLFLASRGRNHPADFAAADLQSMKAGMGYGPDMTTIRIANPKGV